MRRVKQVVIDTLNDGTPHALRVHSIRSIPDPASKGATIELPDVTEIPYAELSRGLQTQLRNLLKKAAGELDSH